MIDTTLKIFATSRFSVFMLVTPLLLVTVLLSAALFGSARVAIQSEWLLSRFRNCRISRHYCCRVTGEAGCLREPLSLDTDAFKSLNLSMCGQCSFQARILPRSHSFYSSLQWESSVISRERLPSPASEPETSRYEPTLRHISLYAGLDMELFLVTVRMHM